MVTRLPALFSELARVCIRLTRLPDIASDSVVIRRTSSRLFRAYRAAGPVLLPGDSLLGDPLKGESPSLSVSWPDRTLPLGSPVVPFSLF